MSVFGQSLDNSLSWERERRMEALGYEKCAHCWHFIEPNDVDPATVPGLALAAYVHLDSGEKEHDHDAEPSGDIRTLRQWRTDHPELFTVYADDLIGPNSAHFQPSGAA